METQNINHINGLTYEEANRIMFKIARMFDVRDYKMGESHLYGNGIEAEYGYWDQWDQPYYWLRFFLGDSVSDEKRERIYQLSEHLNGEMAPRIERSKERISRGSFFDHIRKNYP